jgi:hypothetical protein
MQAVQTPPPTDLLEHPHLPITAMLAGGHPTVNHRPSTVTHTPQAGRAHATRPRTLHEPSGAAATCPPPPPLNSASDAHPGFTRAHPPNHLQWRDDRFGGVAYGQGMVGILPIHRLRQPR